MSKPQLFLTLVVLAAVALIAVAASPSKPAPSSLWQVYEQSLKGARYVDLTHTINPAIPVWAGFGRSTFGPALDPKTGKPFTYQKDGFEASRYDLATDSAPSSTRRPIGIPTTRRSTSCRPPTQSVRWW
jgi:hypothetical protein